MMPRRDSTTGPDSFESWARSARTRLERAPETEDAWAAGRSMGDNPGFQRGADTGAGRPSRQAQLAGALRAFTNSGGKGTTTSALAKLDRHPLRQVHPVVLQLLGH